MVELEGYLIHKKPPHPCNLQQAYAQGPTVVLGGGAVSDERGTPVEGAGTRSDRGVAHTFPDSSHVDTRAVLNRGTSPIRKRSTPYDPPRSLSRGLR